MRILVLSDTHGEIEPAAGVLYREQPDAVIHAGDFYRDAGKLAVGKGTALYRVTGNCDSLEAGPEEKQLHLEGKKILVIHGHQFGVKTGLQKLFYRAREAGVDAVVFGHTHVPLNETEAGILLFNPGSVSRPVPGNALSYGILNIEAGEITGYIHHVNPY